MTLAYASPPRPRLRLVKTPVEACIPAGHPKARSWEELAWEDDDWAWYAVEHAGPLDLQDIGDLLGVSEWTIRQIEASALAKLRELEPGITGVQLGSLFAEWDRERHAARRAREEASDRAAAEALIAAFAGAAE